MIAADVYIGIDPGMGGGVCHWTANGGMKSAKMPRSIADLSVLLNSIKERGAQPLCFLEKLQLRHDDTDGKQFRIQKLLANYEQIKTLLTVHNIPYILVHPMTWQSYLNLRVKDEPKKDRKNRYKRAAGNFYPEAKVSLYNADAILLIEFGRRKRQYDERWLIEQLPKQTLKLLL